MQIHNFIFNLRRGASWCPSLVRTICFFAVLVFSGIEASAQFIQEKSLSEIVLTATEQQFAQNTASKPETKTLKYISIGDIAQYAANDTVAFNLPGLGTVSGRAVRVDYKGPDDYVWSGNLTSQPGFFSFIAVPGGKVGFVQTSTRYFGILPFNSTVSLLQEVETTNLTDTGCEVGDPPQEEPPVVELNFCNPEINDCPSEIHILVLFSTDLMGWFAGQTNVWQQIAMTAQGIEAVNIALANSGISNKKIRWRAQWFSTASNFFNNPLNADDDVNQLATNAASLRENLQADLVVMLTGNNYPGIAGISQIGAPSENAAYSIVEIDAIAGPRWTFAHEVGHLLGANHNRSSNCSPSAVCGDNDTNTCAHGFGFLDKDNVYQRTVMALLGTNEGLVRILHYSNPEKSFNGGATGTSDNNNAKLIRNSACFVSAYNHAEWRVSILGPSQWCVESVPSVSFSAVVTPPISGWGLPGTAPYQYVWEASCTPNFSTYYILSTNFSVSLNTPPCSMDAPFWIRLKVTSSEGEQLSEVMRVKVLDCGNGNSKPGGPISGIVVTPNPAHDQVSITLNGFGADPIDLKLSDAKGRTIHAFQQFGDQQTTLDLSNFPSGLYFVTAKSERGIATQKILIQK